MKICVQKRRRDGWWPVYVRLIKDSRIAYVNTGKSVTDEGKDGKGNVIDPQILVEGNKLILEWQARLNALDIRLWDVKECADFLKDSSCPSA